VSDFKVIPFFNNLSIRFKLLTGYTLIFIIATLSGGTMVYFKAKSGTWWKTCTASCNLG